MSYKFLERVRNNISQMLGDTIKKNYQAVVTMPVCSDQDQKTAIKNVTEKAGFEVLKVISDPEAIAFNYYFQNSTNRYFEEGHYFLIYDLGACTFDLAIFEMVNRATIRTIAVDSDINLGGFDFDTLLLEYVISILRSDKDFSGISLNMQLKRKLRKECERVKIVLSTFSEAMFSIIIRGYGRLKIKISSTTFEHIIEEKCLTTLKIIESVLSRSRLSKHQIKKVLLCGGSTAIPQIQRLLYLFFSDTHKFSARISRDESVVQGAALCAAMWSNHRSQSIPNIVHTI